MYLDGFFPASFFSESTQSSWFCSGWRHPPRRSAKGLAVAKERCARSGEKILSNREPEREAMAESDDSNRYESASISRFIRASRSAELLAYRLIHRL